MFVAQLLRPRLIAIVALALVIAGGAYGFAASNSVGASNAGTGSATISGYNAQDISYTYTTDDPPQISDVNFNLYAGSGTTTPVTAATVQTQIYNTASTPTAISALDDCTSGGGGAWTCALSTPVPASDVGKIRVDAHN